MAEQELASEIKEKWVKLFNFPGPITSTPYSVWRSPNGKIEVGIHDLDNEIFCIHKVETDEWFLNPRDIQRLIDKLKVLINSKGGNLFG